MANSAAGRTTRQLQYDDTTKMLTGVSMHGAPVTVYVNGAPIGQTVASTSGEGEWSYDLSGIADGEHEIRAGFIAVSRALPIAKTTTDPFASAAYDLQFNTSTYRGATLTAMLVEAANYVGGLYEREDTGALVSLGGSVLQITANGLEVWPDRTNYVLQSRNMTDAAWTKTGVTPSRSTGRNGSANAGSRLTLDATGSGTCMMAAPATLASGARVAAIDAKHVAGTPTVELTLDGGATWATAADVAITWKRPAAPTQTLANPQFGVRITGNVGDSVDLDYAQLENSSTAGPRISTTTAAVNRPQNRATCLAKPPLRDLVKADTYTAYWEGKMSSSGGRGIFISDAGMTIPASLDGSIPALGVPAGEFLFDVYQKVAYSRAPNGTTKCSVNGGPIRSGSLTSHAALTHFDISTNGAGGSNIRGIVRRCAFWSAAVAEAALIALTS